jgi:hypothetical protein
MRKQKIESVSIQDIKGVVNVQIHRRGSVTEIAGECRAGKSSTIEAVVWVLGGPTVQKFDQPIREGAEKGQGIVELTDLIVKREALATGKERLTITGKEGGKYAQGDLNDLFTPGKTKSLVFDPTEFSRWDEKEQGRVYRLLAGEEWCTKYDQIEAELRAREEARLVAGRSLRKMGDVRAEEPKSPVTVEEAQAAVRAAEACSAMMSLSLDINDVQGQLDEIPEVSPEDFSDLAKEQEQTAQFNQVQEAVLRERAGMERAIVVNEAEVARLESALAQAKSRLALQRDALASAAPPQPPRDVKAIVERIHKAKVDQEAARTRKAYQDRLEKLKGQLGALEESSWIAHEEMLRETSPEALEAARKALAEATAAEISHKVWEGRLAALEALEKEHAEEEAAIVAAREARVQHLAAAPSPTPGLAFGEDGLLRWKGRPLSQLSGEEAIDVSSDIMIALNPKLLAMFLRHGEALDKKAWAKLLAKAEAAGLDVWVATVGDGHGGALIIEAGVLEAGK